jgi:hypothetical protein
MASKIRRSSQSTCSIFETLAFDFRGSISRIARIALDPDGPDWHSLYATAHASPFPDAALKDVPIRMLFQID